jgi:branched-chain amino acid transport system substrate-binding protein
MMADVIFPSVKTMNDFSYSHSNASVRRLFVISLATGLAGIAMPGKAQDSPPKNAIVIGQTTALTGSSANLALPFHQGAKLFFDRLNANGGINGRPVFLSAIDDAGNPATAKANAQKLLKDGSLVLFGSYGSPQTTAVHEALAGSDTILFAPMAAADELRGANFPNLYAMRPGFSEEALAMIRHSETLGMKKFAMVHARDSESMSALDAAERTMNAMGANLVAKTDLSNLQRLLSAQPQSILIIGTPQEAAKVIRDARSQGFRGPIYGFSNTGESLLAEQLGGLGAGVVLSRVTPRSDNAKSAVVRDLIADAQAAKIGRPNVYMLEGYIAARALTEALQRTGRDVSRARLKRAIEAINEWDMGGFRVSFAGNRTGSSLVELSLIDSQGKVRE